MSFASFEEKRPRENERDLRIRELEATVSAMRDALELARQELHDQVQAANAEASAVTDQLTATITALRQELQAQQQRHEEALQRQRHEATDEARQLQATIRALREELDKRRR